MRESSPTDTTLSRYSSIAGWRSTAIDERRRGGRSHSITRGDVGQTVARDLQAGDAVVFALAIGLGADRIGLCRARATAALAGPRDPSLLVAALHLIYGCGVLRAPATSACGVRAVARIVLTRRAVHRQQSSAALQQVQAGGQTGERRQIGFRLQLRPQPVAGFAADAIEFSRHRSQAEPVGGGDTRFQRHVLLRGEDLPGRTNHDGDG
jgi:hypothetical protein